MVVSFTVTQTLPDMSRHSHTQSHMPRHTHPHLHRDPHTVANREASVIVYCDELNEE